MFSWKKQTGKYESGDALSLGKVIVGTAHYSSLRSKDDPLAYKSTVLLPGIKSPEGSFATLEEAKAETERRVKVWLTWVGAKIEGL